VSAPAVVAGRSTFSAYFELTKPRITLTVTFTTLVGYAMATPTALLGPGLAATLIGTALVASGASVLNMLIEQDLDALMERTRARPLPAGRLRGADALRLGSLLTALGIAVLAFWSQPAAAGVAALTWASYLFVYTPLKPRTSLSTLVGAFPGALPPVIGWAGATNSVGPGAFVIFAILFLWQIPHFLAIAWLYRDDYARGGLPMLPVIDPTGRTTGRQAVANSIALLLVSLAPTAAGMAGLYYLVGALVLGVGFIAVAVRLAVKRDHAAARQLFLSSMVYLMGLFSLLLLDRT